MAKNEPPTRDLGIEGYQMRLQVARTETLIS